MPFSLKFLTLLKKICVPYIATGKIDHRRCKLGHQNLNKSKYLFPAPAKSTPDLWKSAAENCQNKMVFLTLKLALDCMKSAPDLCFLRFTMSFTLKIHKKMTKKREMTKCHQYAIRLINKYINSCVFIFIN